MKFRRGLRDSKSGSCNDKALQYDTWRPRIESYPATL